MIAGIVRATSRTTEQAGLGLRLRPSRARVKTHSRNAFLREWGIVRSKTTCSALLDTQVVFAKISEELASNHGDQSITGRSRTLNESPEVWRADHVEVDIKCNVPTHLLGQGSHMAAGTDEAALLCAPECETHATAGLGWALGQSQGRFEHDRRAATVVVDARPLRYAVEMRTNDDQGTIAIPSRIGQHVSSQSFAGHGVDLEVNSGAGATCNFK